MKFSFQMVFIAFVVTLAHLIALAALSPVDGEASPKISKVEVEVTEEPIPVSFPVESRISLTATPEQPEIEIEEPEEQEAISIPRSESIQEPTELVEASQEKSKALPRVETPQAESSGPYRLRQISPKPRS